MTDPFFRKVAVIDDDADYLATIALALHHIDLKDSLLIQDLSSTWNMVKEYQPKLVFIDLLMPECEPITTLERLRKTLPTSRIVVFSGQTDPELAAQCRDAGADAYLAKNSRKPLPQRLKQQWDKVTAGEQNPFRTWKQLPQLQQATEHLIDEALTRSQGRQSAAARLLGLSPQAINQRLKRKKLK